jgi:hypothetical protein
VTALASLVDSCVNVCASCELYNKKAVQGPTLQEREAQSAPPQELSTSSAMYAALGKDAKSIFHSRSGMPVNLGNARRRYLHRAAKACRVVIGCLA